MAIPSADTTVDAQVVVDVPVEHAFKMFTEEIGSWKPPEHNLLRVEIAETVFEPRVGGYVYDQGVDGSRCRWARVLAYEPPHRVMFAWSVTSDWNVETDPSKTSEVEVRFIAETTERTRVEVEHRKLDRHGRGWESIRDAVGSPDGWQGYLRRFAARAES